MLRHFYNLVSIPLVFGASPFWLIKTKRRGGLSNRLWEKVGRYDGESPEATGVARPIYVHAASVGEANIARKLISYWVQKCPEDRFLLGVGTSTGFDLARESPPPQTEVLYAPLDLPFVLKRFFAHYRPKLITLIEHEVWPNMMHFAGKEKIPVALANARLSQRSGRRLRRLHPFLGRMYGKLSWAGVQTNEDCPRLLAIGIREEALAVVGSVKFDPALDTPAATHLNAMELLDSLGSGPILMALSTHPGEEVIFTKAASQVPNARIVIIPRHMERRESLGRELRKAGFSVVFRSTKNLVGDGNEGQPILIVDSTGEMPTFTKHAQAAFVGKTLTAKGGQNPCEAIAAEVPVIAGPWFGNFEPLATQLRTAGGLLTIENERELALALQTLAENAETSRRQSSIALNILEEHRGATNRTVEALAKLLNEE